MTAISIPEDGDLNSENTDGGDLNFKNYRWWQLQFRK
jgi:hypothetical protein